ncbi:MAG: hypothetical protein SH850_03780, partial [Planctomycetaceae bacterium]|nr:hypothetical protein [Planctomycetaceae bacterium]
PQLHPKPPPPVYLPIPTPDPPDTFLAMLCIAAALTGVPVFFVAKPVGVIVMLTFGVWWLLMMMTEGMRREMTRKSLKKSHEAECTQMDEEYEEQVQPIEKANKKLLGAWAKANAAIAAEHARLYWAVDEENRRRITPWEAAKAAIEADHRQVIKEAEEANHDTLSAWEAENTARQRAYDKACREIEQENQRRSSAWESLTASRQAEHGRKCREIDTKNGHVIAGWKAANVPWVREQMRWCDSASYATAEIKRLEDEFMAQRSSIVSRFQQRKVEADGLLKSHDGARQDYERELRRAEMDSKRLQLDEHLDKYLIRNARLQRITSGLILALESFGIETAKDIQILENRKVPGIGPVLSQRLFDWRDKLASSFRPKQGLPDSQKSRIANRYAPVLLPLGQAIQTAINDLEAIAASHSAGEAVRVKAIAAAVQNLTVAEAYVQEMKVL